jgi:hypothetical protein
MKPFAAIYSTFLQRGYDQVVHDVAIQRLPVRFAMDRAGGRLRRQNAQTRLRQFHRQRGIRRPQSIVRGQGKLLHYRRRNSSYGSGFRCSGQPSLEGYGHLIFFS